MAAISGPRSLVAATALWITSSCLATAWARDTLIVFDLPPSIECRDVTPDDFRAAHSALKVVEGTLRISARVAQGAETEIVDFLYVIEGPTNSMRFQDYLPNTFLESTVADDQIAITTGSENASGGGLDAHVVYKPVTVGGQLNHNEKKSESSCYKKIVPKELVLASGTTNREHGVFFRLRPSRSASLEGAKEFTFLATVPIGWRGDLCTIACTARAKKSSLFSSTVAPAGAARAMVPLHLVGDAEAADLARAFRQAQQEYAAALAKRERDNVFSTISNHTVDLLTLKKYESPSARQLNKAEKTLTQVQDELTQLAE
jgi:hypothetical protein